MMVAETAARAAAEGSAAAVAVSAAHAGAYDKIKARISIQYSHGKSGRCSAVCS